MEIINSQQIQMGIQQRLNAQYITHLGNILQYGTEVKNTMEALQTTVLVDLAKPLITLKRGLNYATLISTSIDWVLYRIGQEVLLPYMYSQLDKDILSDNILLHLAAHNDHSSQDIALQVAVRNVAGASDLYLFQAFYNKSVSNAWYDLPIDIFNMALLSNMLCILIRDRYKINIMPGFLYLNSNISYIPNEAIPLIKELITSKKIPLDFDYSALDLNNFASYQEYMKHLLNMSMGIYTPGTWLSEICQLTK